MAGHYRSQPSRDSALHQRGSDDFEGFIVISFPIFAMGCSGADGDGGGL
jgi:hypothetical protein